MLASFIPFLTETIFQNLRRAIAPGALDPELQRSVHFLPFPEVDTSLMDPVIIETMASVKAVA